ncbi:multi-sensor signal transduction histidine kinase [Fictibacillus macauensis ZFHKF-1]|uniref:histidine kinase n=1 Tax=Fictibacillus macauensis ZFHKF-1 TaxID=1196324 RepID=I8J458_9BACL|nr:ATP-binding protein [Fictibacillus macauensis]EIT86551.1 multi-sensor signal transduction histidine kinase [Fictibacillus macauensis ZFHKF-1]
MIWRSVVGKLWLTIILLVSVVLFTLTILLTQFVGKYYDEQAEDRLTKLAQKMTELVEHYESREEAIRISSELVDAYSLNAMVIMDKKEYYAPSPKKGGGPDIPVSVFFQNKTLANVYKKGQKGVEEGDFPVTMNGKEIHHRLLIVGLPFHMENGKKGAVYIYQSLENIAENTNYTKRLIFLSAGIAIILTTIFAFFLSSRITAPLRKMREAAAHMARGEFDMKVPMLTHDEIGELAMAFNRMGRQLKNNINALNQEKEQLSGILSSMADGVITFDRRMKMLVSNPPAQAFLHAYREGMGFKEDALPEALQELFQDVVMHENNQFIEMNFQGRTWVIVMTPLYNQSYVRGAVAVLRDMTEERKADKLRKDFIANVSHELRTPIAMLQGYSEAIVDDVAGSREEEKEIVKIIHDESLRMGRLVSELLDLARLEAGQMKLHPVTVHLPSYFERVVRKFNGLAKERNIEVTLQMNGIHDSEASFDPDRMEQVLTNLIDNAIRHTSEGGTVTISVQRKEATLSIQVADNGSGIAEEDLPFVFERFYKADKARTRGKKGGTGLGLAIAKNIVDNHHGKISVQSKWGEGTTFSISLPFAVEQ